ncbi:MAG: RteC domain-containing protein [Lutibacter sp.]|uniref:RteC domain-containing protein n=1 Tax=Lutibacter sp. TaxID=1925666 RepID=UPI00299DF789|nr:RteC domain-containing protein [Lutibacter sp.]MDX1828833.1 RteC domain-containing protein [Lutibacter sp.]
MKKIAEIIANYSNELFEIEQLQLKESKKLKKKIELTKDCLNKLRLYIREIDFPSEEEEINFFKYQKPGVYGNLKYFSHINKYQLVKPKSNLTKQKKLINGYLDKLENWKVKHLGFYRYYEQNDTSFDAAYFLRRNTQLELIFDTLHLDREPEFSTSYDLQAAKVIAYNLLTNYYEKELINIKQLENNLPVKEVKPKILTDIPWTASKTELAELVISLIAFGAIKNGNVDMKKIAEGCKELFGIDLGNIYNTYTQIKSRKKDPTKFLDKLKFSLIKKLEADL